MRFLIQREEDITTDDKENNKKYIVHPDILENIDKLKKPEEIQGMWRIGKRQHYPAVLVDIIENVGILHMIECLDRTYKSPVIGCEYRKSDKKIKKLVCGKREKRQTKYNIRDFPGFLASLRVALYFKVFSLFGRFYQDYL